MQRRGEQGHPRLWVRGACEPPGSQCPEELQPLCGGRGASRPAADSQSTSPASAGHTEEHLTPRSPVGAAPSDWGKLMSESLGVL